MSITYEGFTDFTGGGGTGTGDMLIENIKTVIYNYTVGNPSEFTIPEAFSSIISVCTNGSVILQNEYTIDGQKIVFTNPLKENSSVQIQYYKT